MPAHTKRIYSLLIAFYFYCEERIPQFFRKILPNLIYEPNFIISYFVIIFADSNQSVDIFLTKNHPFTSCIKQNNCKVFNFIRQCFSQYLS